MSEAPGPPVGDVWTDISPLQGGSTERLGYPTQKPEALLERIIRSATSENQIVLDPFCGCGTTIAVAERLGRQWIGVDISPTAVGVMERRLLKATNGAIKVRLEGLPVTEADLRKLKPFEFQNWVIGQISGTQSPRKSGDMGIDGWSFMYHDPIQVKQSERVGRNVVDNFETAVERSGKDVGYIVAFSFTRGAHEEAARAKAKGKARIVLVTVSELIEGAKYLLGPVLIQALPLPDPGPAQAPTSPRRPTPDLIGIFGNIKKNVFDRPAMPSGRPTDSAAELVASDLESVG
jgi:hypothetical protein